MTLEAPRPVSEPTPETKTPRKKRNSRTILVAGGAAVTIAAGAAIGFGAAAANQAPKIEPVAEAPANPDIEDGSSVENQADQTAAEQPVAPESNVDVTQLPENVLTYNMFETLPAESQEKLLTLDEMPLADFRQQPVEDQLMFGDFIIDNNSEIADYRLSKNGIVNLKNDSNPTTPETVYNSINYRFALLSSLKELTTENGVTFDTETAKKASVVVVNPEDFEYQAYIDSRIDQWDINTKMTMAMSKVIAGEIDAEGASRTNTESPTGDKAYNVASPKQFINYLGQPDSIYTTDLSVVATDVRYTDLSK